MNLMKFGKNRKENIIRIVLIACILFVAWFILDNIFFDIRKENNGKDKYLYVAYLLVDSDKVDSDVKFTDISSTEAYSDKVLDFVGTNVPVKKDGDYYVADFKTMNESAYKNITDYFVSMNNAYAEKVDDIKVDINKHEVLIPAKYYEDSKYTDEKNEKVLDKNSPVQMELLSVIDEEDLNNSKIDLTISRFFNTKDTLTVKDGNDFIDIKLFNKPKNIKRDDLKIYVNNSKYSLPISDYSYSNKTGILRLNIGRPIEVNNIKIKIRKFYALNFLNIFRIESAEAATAPIVGTYSVSGGTLHVGDNEQVFMPYMYGSAVASKPAASSGYNVYCGGPISDNFDCATAPSNYVSLSTISTAWNNYLSSSINTGTVPGAAYFAFRRKAYHCDIYAGQSCSLVNFDYLNFGSTHLSMSFDPGTDWLRGTCIDHIEGYNNTPLAFAVKFWIAEVNTAEKTITIEFESTATSGGQRTGGHFKLRDNTPSTEPGKIKVKKTVSDGSDADGYSFELYNNSDCTGTKIQGPLTSNTMGEVTFTNLSAGTYCVREVTTPDGYAIRNGVATSYKPYFDTIQTSDKYNVVVYNGATTTVPFDNRDNPPNEDYCLRIKKWIQNDDGSREALANIPFTLSWYSSIHGDRSLGTVYTDSNGVAFWRWNDRDLPCGEDGGCYLHNFTVTEGLVDRESAWQQYTNNGPYVYGIGPVGTSGPVIWEYLYGDIKGQTDYLCNNNFGLPCGGNWNPDPDFTGATMPKCTQTIINPNTGHSFTPQANVMSEFTDTKVYFCLKVKKEDENGDTIDPSALSDLVFEASHNGRKIRNGQKYNYNYEPDANGRELASVSSD